MSATREVLLGWRNSSPQAALAYFKPKPLNQTESAALSPLFSGYTQDSDLASRVFVIRSPFNIRIRVRTALNGQVSFMRIAEPGGISDPGFRGLVTPVAATAQRDTETPACQIALNLVVISDEPCSLQLMPPFYAPGFRNWPGSLVCGRFPLQNWPRPLNAVLEWQDKSSDWILKRGDPLIYLIPIYDDPSVYPKIIEAGMTPSVQRHLKRIDDVTSFGRNVGPMFIEAERMRPAKLLIPKKTAE